jgi:hypothetical protein
MEGMADNTELIRILNEKIRSGETDISFEGFSVRRDLKTLIRERDLLVSNDDSTTVKRRPPILSIGMPYQ